MVMKTVPLARRRFLHILSVLPAISEGLPLVPALLEPATPYRATTKVPFFHYSAIDAAATAGCFLNPDNIKIAWPTSAEAMFKL